MQLHPETCGRPLLVLNEACQYQWEPMPHVRPPAGEDGWTDWQPPQRHYRLGCCDCGLVHDMEFRLVAVKRKRNGTYRTVKINPASCRSNFVPAATTAKRPISDDERRKNMKAKDLLPLLLHELDPEMEVRCIEETEAGRYRQHLRWERLLTAIGESASSPSRRPTKTSRPSEPIQAHELRAKSLAMLRSQMDSLRRMVQAEAIDDLPAAMMAAHYALMELNLDTAQERGIARSDPSAP